MLVIYAATMAPERPHGLVRGASFALDMHVVDEDDELAEKCPEKIAANVVLGALEQLRWVAE